MKLGATGNSLLFPRRFCTLRALPLRGLYLVVIVTFAAIIRISLPERDAVLMPSAQGERTGFILITGLDDILYPVQPRSIGITMTPMNAVTRQ